MGTKGTLVLEHEQEVMLYKNSDTTTRVGVKDDKGGPTLDTQASGKGPLARQGRRRQRPGQPRLHRRDRALGLVHPQARPARSPQKSSPAARPKSPWATPSSP